MNVRVGNKNVFALKEKIYNCVWTLKYFHLSSPLEVGFTLFSISDGNCVHKHQLELFIIDVHCWKKIGRTCEIQQVFGEEEEEEKECGRPYSRGISNRLE